MKILFEPLSCTRSKTIFVLPGTVSEINRDKTIVENIAKSCAPRNRSERLSYSKSIDRFVAGAVIGRTPLSGPHRDVWLVE